MKSASAYSRVGTSAGMTLVMGGDGDGRWARCESLKNRDAFLGFRAGEALCCRSGRLTKNLISGRRDEGCGDGGAYLPS